MTTVPRDAGNHIPPTSHVEALGGQTSFLIKSPHKNDEASGSNQRELLAIRRERELFVGDITNGCAYRTADASAYTRALADAKSIAVLAADTPTFIAPISNALYPSPLYDACAHGHAWSLRL